MQRRARVAGAVVIAAIGALLSAQSASRRRATSPFPPATIRAVDDAYVAQRAQAMSVSAANGVLANDFGPKKLIAILTTPPQHGFLTFLPDGSFTYTNDGTDAASDSFAYKISDGTDASLPANVTITVTSAAPPVAQGDAYSVANNGTLQVATPGLLANDSDPSGLALTAIVVANPTHGLLTLGANGAFTYKHDGTSSTLDLFTYRVSNGTQLSSPATVTLSIGGNVPPNVSNHSYSGTQDTPLVVSAPGVLAGAIDSDSAQLMAIAVAAPAHGTLALAKDGSFTYTPAAGYSGSDSFTYQASDGVATSTNTGIATLTILSPASANGDAYTAAMNLPRAVPAPGVLTNDPSGSAILSYGAATGREQTAMGALTPTVQNGTVALQSDGGFSYSPPAGFFGVDTFRYIVGNSVSSTAAVVVITVSAPPIASNDSYFAARNTARTVPAPGVLNNDTLNDATLARASGPLHGTLTLNSDGSFLYVPTSGYVGDDQFAYSLSNATGTVQATVTLRVVAPPIAVADAFLNRTSVATPGVFAGDTRNDATIVSYGKTGGEQTTIGQATATDHGSVTVQADGSFVYAPTSGYIGNDTFAYVLSNFAGQSTATVTMTTQPPPVLQNDSYDAARNTARTVAAADGVMKNDTPNGLGITAFSATSTNGGTVALNIADGSFTYTPATNFVGNDTFTYTVGSGTFARTATVTMKVVAPPVAVNDAYATAANGTLVDASSVLANDVTNGGKIISYGKTTGTEQTTVGQPTPTNVAGASVSINADGTFTYVPAPTGTGSDSFSYVVGNYAGGSAATVTIAVVGPPIAVDDVLFARNDGETDFGDKLLANDVRNSATAIPQMQNTARGGKVILTSDGHLTYGAPSGGFEGTDSFQYTLTNIAGSDTATVTVNVVKPPAARNDDFTVGFFGGNAGNVLANDDHHGSITFTDTTFPPSSDVVVTLDSNGDIHVTRTGSSSPNALDYSFQYTIRNSDLGISSTATVILHVQAFSL